MTTYSPSQENYRELAHLLARFTSLTQIKTIFYDFTGILLKDDFVYINHSAIEDNLAQLTFSDYAIFPVSRNIQMWGAVLCESVNVSKKRLFLSRSYLENLMTQIFDEDTLGKVSVWEPLTSDQVGQINNPHALFHPTGDTDPLQAVLAPNAVIAGHTIDNDEAFRSISLAIDYIQKNIQRPISLNEVAQRAYLSPSYLSRLFKKYLHVNFIEYVNNQKIALAQEKLSLTLTPINQISNQIGFTHKPVTSRKFLKRKRGSPHPNFASAIIQFKKSIPFHVNSIGTRMTRSLMSPRITSSLITLPITPIQKKVRRTLIVSAN